jgi:cell division protein FtsB
MPLNVDVNQALVLLGHKTLELELLRAQSEQVAQEYNKLKEENEALKSHIDELESEPRLREVK